jgi:hypothetical protein
MTPQNTTVHDIGFEALDSVSVDSLCVFVSEDERPLKGLAGYVDWRMCGALSRVLRNGFFTGMQDDCLLLPTEGRLAMGRVFAVGCGRTQRYTAEALGQVLASAARILTRANVQAVALELPGVSTLDEGVRASALLSQFAPSFGGQRLAVLAEKGLSRALFGSAPAKAAP